MSPHRSIPTGSRTTRPVNLALAALREAAECLEEAIPAGDRPDADIASALSHVAAARTALRPHGFGATSGRPDREAA